ncbi:ribose 5-phosphate isomerase B [bacterium]|nr:ribose 5-phosphate isomerase B [bacterium]
MKKIPIASDHAGFDLKQILIPYLEEKGFDVVDMGCYSNESVDYPDIIHPLAKEINEGNYEFGIIICGTGNGVSMVANKYPNVRCALCWKEEIASLAKQHNNANIIALAARFTPVDIAKKIIDSYLSSSFEGDRHLRRINKIPVH